MGHNADIGYNANEGCSTMRRSPLTGCSVAGWVGRENELKPTERQLHDIGTRDTTRGQSAWRSNHDAREIAESGRGPGLRQGGDAIAAAAAPTSLTPARNAFI